jgi:hypothetical protein
LANPERPAKREVFSCEKKHTMFQEARACDWSGCRED